MNLGEGAMPSLPKDPSTRQRRNRTAGARTLQVVADPVKAPTLPKADEPWHKMTVAWWKAVWSSPMAPEYDESDLQGLFVLAVLVDGFWKKPSAATAAEIRLQGQRFGLSPLDRRRLAWEIERGEEAEERTQRRRSAAKAPKTGKSDPRASLAG